MAVFPFAGGYYSISTLHDLRIIALNTNYYYKDFLTKYADDPAGQFGWLEAQLSEAGMKNQKVNKYTMICHF